MSGKPLVNVVYKVEYAAWSNAIQRCGNPKHTSYANYGGRGICVCDRWKKFKNFLGDMGRKPEGASLDRIDNDGNYEPGNCKWSTKHQQVRNARSNRYVAIDGKRMIIADWARASGTLHPTICWRLNHGWPDREAVFGKKI